MPAESKILARPRVQELLLHSLKLRDLSSSASVIVKTPDGSLGLKEPSRSPGLAQQVGNGGLLNELIGGYAYEGASRSEFKDWLGTNNSCRLRIFQEPVGKE